MTQKLLPLPLGGNSPRGSGVRFWEQHAFRTRVDLATMLAGFLLTAAGAWIGLHPRPVLVGVDGAGYHLGGTVLQRVGAHSFGGDTAIVFEVTGSRLRAAAAGRVGHDSMQGTCVFMAGAETEDCAFIVGGIRFRAQDRVVAGTWRRRYDDGRVIELKLVDPRHPAPVPVPVGWR